MHDMIDIVVYFIIVSILTVIDILHSILFSGEHNLSIIAENHKHNLELQ